MTDVDVELARSAQLVARARRQQAVERLQKATVELRLVLAARWMLAFAIVATGMAGVGATPWFFACTVLCCFALVGNVRTVGPQHLLARAERELDYAQAHADWDTAHQRMLDTEALHEETPVSTYPTPAELEEKAQAHERSGLTSEARSLRIPIGDTVQVMTTLDYGTTRVDSEIREVPVDEAIALIAADRIHGPSTILCDVNPYQAHNIHERACELRRQREEAS